MTTQNYDVHTFLVTVIRGNDALFKCTVPSFVSDFLAITGWWDSEGNQLGVRNGNFGWVYADKYQAILRHKPGFQCIFKIKSATFQMILVSLQRYEVDILRESVIIGNDAVFKCSIPSFVTDFVRAVSWIDSEGQSYSVGPLGNSEDLLIVHAVLLE